jgi:hypothetical protein
MILGRDVFQYVGRGDKFEREEKLLSHQISIENNPTHLRMCPLHRYTKCTHFIGISGISKFCI